VDVLAALLIELIVIAVLFEVARRLGLPYPALFVLGGVALGVVPWIPHITLEPDLVLLVFLPPLLFEAAFGTPLRDLRANLWPIARLSIGLVVATMVVVAVVAQALVPGLGWAAAFALGAIVAPTDAIAATGVFRRLGVPRVVITLVEGESLFNDATALIAYRAAVVAVITGSFVLTEALGNFVVAAIGGIAIGWVIGRVMAEIVKWLDDPPVEVVVSLLIPYLAFLTAEHFPLTEQLHFSGVLAVVTAGLVIGRRLGTMLSPSSRVLWLTSWKMVGFILNGLVFVLLGLALPDILRGEGVLAPLEFLGVALLVCAAVIVTRFVWVYLTSLLPNSPRRRVAERDPELARRLTFLVGWSGLRGAVSLAAALALPLDFPQRNLLLLLTFAVILATLVGQGLTLPWVVRWARWDGQDGEADEAEFARATMYAAGLGAVRLARARWPNHEPLLERLESGLHDREQHLASEDPDETDERRLEHLEHQEIQLSVISSERNAIIALRDAGEINDATLRELERELDLEELRMEA
jgi:CPA1 family monovalent cation:H+ antiporter